MALDEECFVRLMTFLLSMKTAFFLLMTILVVRGEYPWMMTITRLFEFAVQCSYTFNYY